MTKYTDPKLNVSVFDAESVITGSGTNPANYSDWQTTNNATGVTLDYNSFKAVSMGE